MTPVPAIAASTARSVAGHRADDGLIDDLARDGTAYVPFFPLGGFTPLQSSTLSDVARRLAATPMQVALAWLLARSPNILLIPGTSSVAHLRENLAASKLVLPSDALAALDRVDKRRCSDPLAITAASRGICLAASRKGPTPNPDLGHWVGQASFTAAGAEARERRSGRSADRLHRQAVE